MLGSSSTAMDPQKQQQLSPTNGPSHAEDSDASSDSIVTIDEEQFSDSDAVDEDELEDEDEVEGLCSLISLLLIHDNGVSMNSLDLLVLWTARS